MIEGKVSLKAKFLDEASLQGLSSELIKDTFVHYSDIRRDATIHALESFSLSRLISIENKIKITMYIAKEKDNMSEYLWNYPKFGEVGEHNLFCQIIILNTNLSEAQLFSYCYDTLGDIRRRNSRREHTV